MSGAGMLSSQHSAAHREPRPGTSRRWHVEVFFDGDCPLCRREIALLQWLDRHGKIRCTDITATDFDPNSYGHAMSDFMDEIQGRLSDGRWITGVEVFRQLYQAVGFAPLVRVTRWPGIAHVLEWGYQKFAKHRLKLTGRCDANCRI